MKKMGNASKTEEQVETQGNEVSDRLPSKQPSAQPRLQHSLLNWEEAHGIRN